MKKKIFFLLLICSNILFAEDCDEYSPIKYNNSVKLYIEKEFMGFRIVDTSNYVDNWCEYYENGLVPYYQEGDFNGDSIIDYAVMIYSENIFRIIILHNKGGDKFSHHIVTEENAEGENYYRDNLELDIGFGISPPDEYYNIKMDSFFTVKTNSLDIYKLEEPIELYYWTNNKYILHSYDDLKESLE